MASGSINLSSAKAWAGSIWWSSEMNIEGNYSDLYVCASMWKTEGELTSSNSPTSGTITVDGAQYALIGYKEFREEVCIFEDTFRIYHNSDGSKYITISLSCRGQSATSLASATLSGSGTVVLDTIPRGSAFTIGSARTLGSAMSFTINKQSSSFTGTILYSCGDISGTVVNKTYNSSVSWTPPLSLASQVTDGTTVPVTFTLVTYNGSTYISYVSETVNLSIPTSVVPTVSMRLSDPTGCYSKYGAYIQTKSTVQISLTASGLYGSTITAQQITFDGKTYTGEQITTEVIKGSGTMRIVATVTDSRGRSATITQDITVSAYSPPTVTNPVAERCNADGSRYASGNYLAVVFDAVVTPLGNRNSAVYTLKYKKTGDSDYTSVTLSALTGKYMVSGYQYIVSAVKDSSYDIVISIKDDFPAVDKSISGSSELTLWSMMRNGMGYAFGKIAERIGYLDMGFHIHMNGKRIHGLPEPQDADEAVTIQYLNNNKVSLLEIYPVGAIYLSAVETSPASLFGGTWTQLKDKFLLAAGDWFNAGETGGEHEHKLTIEEMPRHRHWGNARFDYDYVAGSHPSAYSDGANINSIYSDYAGGDSAHNNMPPYLVVYMWMRVA